MRNRLPLILSLLALVALASVAFIACGGDDDDSDATPGAGETTTPSGGNAGPPLSDEEYLEVICTGASDYTAALMTERDEEPIRQVVLDYIGSLETVSPPEDLGEFHQSLIGYLEAALEHPTDLTVTPRPLPPDEVRDRLADKEDDVDACRNAQYFAPREDDAS